MNFMLLVIEKLAKLKGSNFQIDSKSISAYFSIVDSFVKEGNYSKD